MNELHLVTLSAPNERELRRSAGAMASLAASGSLDAAAAEAPGQAGRARLFARGTAPELASKLRSFAVAEPCDVQWRGAADGDSPAVAVLFTGQSDHHPGMSRQLYETSATFRRALDRCSKRVERYLGDSLTAAMFDRGGDGIDQASCA